MQPDESGESRGGSGERRKVRVYAVEREIDEEQIMILTQADTHTFQKSLGKVVLISGIVWSCLCSEVSVVEFFNSIGGVEVNKEIPCVPFIL